MNAKVIKLYKMIAKADYFLVQTGTFRNTNEALVKSFRIFVNLNLI